MKKFTLILILLFFQDNITFASDYSNSMLSFNLWLKNNGYSYRVGCDNKKTRNALCYDENGNPLWEDKENNRIVMQLHPHMAPVTAVVCPLVKKDGLPELGRKLMDELKPHFKVVYDQQGSIGKRYYRQDEAGTPFGITIDHQSTEDKTVTLRHRDTQQQDRVAMDQLVNAINDSMEAY